MKRIVSMMVIFTLLLGGMTHVQAQTSKAAEKAEKKQERKEKKEEKGRYTVLLEKGDEACACPSSLPAAGGRGKTLILFSDDLDKALATFVLANGAAATGQKVSIFFTFWGLNVLKKMQKPRTEKDIFGKMFGMMLPSNSLKLKLSKMNMMGMGSRMMRFLPEKHLR